MTTHPRPRRKVSVPPEVRPFDFSRVVPYPDTLKIHRELRQAQAMHDKAMGVRSAKPETDQ